MWVQVSDDLAIDKIMHSLREKDKSTSLKKSKVGNNSNKNYQTEKVARSNSLMDDEEDALVNLEPIGEELKEPSKRRSSISGESNVDNEDTPAGQFDDIFDDININVEQKNYSTGEGDESVGQYDDLFDDIEENNGQCDDLLVDNAKDNAAGQFDDLFDDDIPESNGPALEEECGSLDDDGWSESRLVGQDSDDVTNEQHPLHELTLQQWVGRCKLKFMGRDTMQTEPDQMLGFTKAALPIVLKLTDFLIEAEKDEQNGKVNPVPLESIVAGNVIIRSKEPDAMRSGEEQKELIDYVWIMSSMGDNQYDPNAGTVMARLCAMGNVLCELFVGDETNSYESVGTSF